MQCYVTPALDEINSLSLALTLVGVSFVACCNQLGYQTKNEKEKLLNNFCRQINQTTLSFALRNSDPRPTGHREQRRLPHAAAAAPEI